MQPVLWELKDLQDGGSLLKKQIKPKQQSWRLEEDAVKFGSMG